MGHHLFIHNRKSLPMRDFDVALVRHFLIEGATRLRDKPLADEVAEQLGEEVSVDYLNGKVQLPGGHWLKGQPTSDVVALIRGLEEHLHGRT